MEFKVDKLLHPRIAKSCEKLFSDGHYPSAALEAMKQVELALKEKSGEKNKFGIQLITKLLGEGKSVKLKMPFGEEMQKQTEDYFKGTFSFYRNYAAHDGSKFNQITCLRSLVVASELLELIGASEISFADIGGIPGFIKLGLFANESDVYGLLKFLSSYGSFPIDVVDGYFENLTEKGYDDTQVKALLDTDLIEFVIGTRDYSNIPDDWIDDYMEETRNEEIGWWQLTKQGESVLNSTTEI
jgi:uncharacterized protein (TIGR02391 family)